MKRKHATRLLWGLSVVLTLGIAVFQRTTGPTWPVTGSLSIDGKVVTFRFQRSNTAHESLPVRVEADQPEWAMTVEYRRYPGDDPWCTLDMQRVSGGYVAALPGQPAAGKLAYRVQVETATAKRSLTEAPVIARFKGKVPVAWLVLHILFMLMGIVLCVRTGLESLRADPKFQSLVKWTLGAIALGGMIFGPLVQKYAFGDFWTGFPLGTDLTDNKTMLAFIFWLAAFFLFRRSRWWVFAAALLTLVVYLIPHSLAGSELDYSSGTMRNKFSLAAVSSVMSTPPQTEQG